jgi:TetR/AcrR family transcriptional repressor of lmrAB and yxaGH operons
VAVLIKEPNLNRAERLAILCVSALQGALIQSRVERGGEPIETAADELARLLEAAATELT